MGHLRPDSDSTSSFAYKPDVLRSTIEATTEICRAWLNYSAQVSRVLVPLCDLQATQKFIFTVCYIFDRVAGVDLQWSVY